jgi:hypothetical protein
VTFVVLVGIILLLFGVLLFREPELRRWGARVARRREGTIRAAVGRFQPRDIQRQALALIKEQSQVSIGYAHLPSDVTVFLNPDDLERLGAAREHVTRELAEQITQLDKKSAGGEVVYLLAARPQVKLEAAPLNHGTVEIAPAWLEGTSPLTAMLPTDAAGPDPTAPRLRIEPDGSEPTEVVLSGRMTIGRAPASTIPINHEGISRDHAVIEVDDDCEVTITDLGSLNGVEIGKVGRIRPKAPVRIEPGEVVRLGRHVRLELVSEKTEVQPTRGEGHGD